MAFTIIPVSRPGLLSKSENGRIDPSLLRPLSGGVGALVEPAQRAWDAMRAAALADGIELSPTSSADAYRPYAVQERTFTNRYSPTPLAGRPTRTWQGRTWWQKPGTATSAVPGTSNHGWGLAVDVANANGERLDWIVANCLRHGFSHELQSEPWHVRYTAGDNIPQAVLDFEAAGDDEEMAITEEDLDRIADRVWKRMITAVNGNTVPMEEIAKWTHRFVEELHQRP